MELVTHILDSALKRESVVTTVGPPHVDLTLSNKNGRIVRAEHLNFPF